MKEKILFYAANCVDKAKILLYNILFGATEACGKILASVLYRFKSRKTWKK